MDAVDDGHAPTWTYDSDGDFTHDRPQWRDALYLQPEVGDGVLTFTVVLPEDKELTKEVYAVYHGRFVEFALNHADKLFSRADVSAEPEGADATGENEEED